MTEQKWMAAGYAFCVAGVAGVGLTDPGHWLDLSDYGPMGHLQWMVLFAALAVAVAMAIRTRGEERCFWLVVAPLVWFLFWRELDFDSNVLTAGDRAYSWGRMFETRLSLPQKLMLYVPSIGLTALWAVYVVRHLGAITRGVRRRLAPATVLWTLGALGLLLGSQLWDRKYVGTNRPPERYTEEALELLGEIAVLVLVVTLARFRPREGP